MNTSSSKNLNQSLTREGHQAIRDYVRHAHEKIMHSEIIADAISKAIIDDCVCDENETTIVLDLLYLDTNQVIELIALGQFSAAYIELYYFLCEKMNQLLPKDIARSVEASIISKQSQLKMEEAIGGGTFASIKRKRDLKRGILEDKRDAASLAIKAAGASYDTKYRAKVEEKIKLAGGARTGTPMDSLM